MRFLKKLTLTSPTWFLSSRLLNLANTPLSKRKLLERRRKKMQLKLSQLRKKPNKAVKSKGLKLTSLQSKKTVKLLLRLKPPFNNLNPSSKRVEKTWNQRPVFILSKLVVVPCLILSFHQEALFLSRKWKRLTTRANTRSVFGKRWRLTTSRMALWPLATSNARGRQLSTIWTNAKDNSFNSWSAHAKSKTKLTISSIVLISFQLSSQIFEKMIRPKRSFSIASSSLAIHSGTLPRDEKMRVSNKSEKCLKEVGPTWKWDQFAEIWLLW